MFNLAVGYIELCRSNFTLRADITPQIIEDNLADVILDRKKINTQFLYYLNVKSINNFCYLSRKTIDYPNRLTNQVTDDTIVNEKIDC